MPPSRRTESVMRDLPSFAMLDGIVDGFLHDTIQVHRHSMVGNVDGMMTADLAGAVKQRLHTGG